MTNLKKLKILFGVILLTTITSCQNDPESLEVKENNKLENTSKLSRTAKKLKNPYTVENMRKAFRKLKEKGLDKSSKNAGRIMEDLAIETSDLYVMYDPQTIEAEAELKQDSTLILADYPLDYDYTQEELKARPALPEGEVSDYYTAIRIDSEQASDDSYVLLDELYIPEQDPYFQGSATQIARTTDPNVINTKEDLLRHLLYEAYKLTGNESELDQVPLENGRWIFGTRWWPSGTISIYDEVAGGIKPVVGAQVLIRQWFTVRQGITDANGHFSTSSVRGSSRYIIQWERYNYSIRNGSLFQAELRGPVKKEEAWNYTINNGVGDSDDKYHALIHQAANDYYYGHRFGLISPPRNKELYSFGWQRQIKISAREISNGDYTGSYSHLKGDLSSGIISQISVRKWGSPSDEIYGTTIHELAHAAHSVLDRGSYDNLVRDAWIIPWQGGVVVNNNRRTLESWARTVETVMTLDRYKTNFGNLNYSVYKTFPLNKNNYQYQTVSNANHYTSVGIDLMDSFNQRQSYGNSFPIDNVSGYNINQLEASLLNANSWWQWRDNLKARFNNPTKQFVDELFNNWQN